MKKTFFALILVALSAFCARAVTNDFVIIWNPRPAAESNQLYRVYVSTNSTTVFALAGTTINPTFTVSNVPAGTYGASITASNIWGEQVLSPPVYGVGPVMLPGIITGVSVFIRSTP